MEALILDKNFQAQCIIDAFDSFIWTDRYNTPGDFEIYMLVDRSPLEYMKRDYYVWIRNSDRLQVIEDISIDTDAEDGNHITITGRTLESLLDRRVVFSRTVINGSLQSGIQKLLNENVINPSDSYRKLPYIRFVSSSDSRITSLTMKGSYLGESILEIIEEQCQVNDLGFKIVYNEKNMSFDFSLYYGEDRSYAQDKNPWVVFSSAYENLVGSKYFESYANLKTAAVVLGSEDDEKGQEVVDYNGKPNMTGMDRREMCVNASDIERPEVTVNEESIRERLKKRNKTESEIKAEINLAYSQANAQSRSQYRQMLEERGKEEVKATYITETFEGEIEAVRQYVYDRDFFIGDVVQVRNQYGKEASSRITEVVRVHDRNGESLSPTFTTLVGSDNKGNVPLSS